MQHLLILSQAVNYLNIEILQVNTIPGLVVTENYMSLCNYQTSLEVSDDIAKEV